MAKATGFNFMSPGYREIFLRGVSPTKVNARIKQDKSDTKSAPPISADSGRFPHLIGLSHRTVF